MGQGVICSFVVVGRCNFGPGCRFFDAGGVSCEIEPCAGRDGRAQRKRNFLF